MFRDSKIITQSEDLLQQGSINYSKNEENLKHKIPLHLRNYESLKEWSDLSQWLLKLQQIFLDNPCSYLPKKKLFCKRLAQCLSPIWNKAIHENALIIYDIVLQNLTTQKYGKNQDYKLVDDLPLFSLGLFPFFGLASSQCKPMVLDIFQKFYYPLGPQLIPSICGLVSSIIVGMEDTNEDSIKKVIYSLDQAQLCVGVKCFFGALWICILRSSKTRMGSYKYLMKRWNKQKQDTQDIIGLQQLVPDNFNQDNDLVLGDGEVLKSSQTLNNVIPNDLKKSTSNRMIQSLEKIINDPDKLPNRGALVLNAILASLEDEQSLIKRASLDFLSSHAKITDGVFNREENMVLVQACLLLFMKPDHAVVRRINNWFFGEIDLNQIESLKDLEIIQLIAEALNNIIIEDLWKGQYDAPEKQEEVHQNTPLRIIQNWYMQHPETIELTLEHIGYQLVRYMHNYSNNPTIQKASERLLESIASNCELILESLYSLLQKKIIEKRVDLVLDLVKLLNYCLNNLMRNQFGVNALIKEESEIDIYKARTQTLQNLIQIIIMEIIQIIPAQFYKLPLSEAVLELALQCLIKVQIRVENTQLWTQKLECDQLSDQAVKKLDKNQFNQQDQIENKYLETLNKFELYYVQLNNYAVENTESIEDSGKIIIFQLISQILLKMQLFVIRAFGVDYTQMPEWLICLLHSVQIKSPRISIASIETVLEIIKNQGTNPNCLNLVHLLTINKHLNIKHISELNSLVKLSSQQNQLTDLSNQQDEHNYMREIFDRLWSLLDYHYQDSKVIDSIMYFSKHFPQIFTYVVEIAFLNAQNENELEIAIRRYQIFCRLTNPHFRKFSHENKGVGVLMMLSYLEHENPLMRYASKTWLTETAPFLFRILDPLLERLINDQVVADGFYVDNKLIYNNLYNYEVVIDTVKKLNLLLADIKEWYMPYIQNAQISKTLQDKLKQYNEKEIISGVNDLKYLDLILNILSRYIQGGPNESQSIEFRQQNSRVNALCCEQFESLLTNVQVKSVQATIIVQYLESFLQLLRQQILRNDSLMQIQILNLIKQFTLAAKDVELSMTQNQREQLIKIISSDLFIRNMLNGLKTSKVFYLKSRYLNTLILSIHTISDLLPQIVLTQVVVFILETLLSLLRNHEYNLKEQTKKQELTKTEQNDFDQDQQNSLKRVSNVDYAGSQYFKEEKKKQYNQQVFETHTIKEIAQYQEVIERKKLAIMSSQSGENFEEVMKLSNSIKELMGFFFRFKDEIKDDGNKSRFSGILIDIFTLNLLKSGREKQLQLAQKTLQPQFIQFQDTCSMILNSFPIIISSYLNCWTLGVPKELWTFFNSKGVIVYEYSNFEYFNQTMKEQLNKLDDQYTDDYQIKQSIMSIMSPCAFQFKSELISACIQIWSDQYSHNFYDAPVYNVMMYKLMELMIMLHMDSESFMQAFMKTQQVVKMQTYYQKKQPSKKGMIYINQDLATQENDLFFFLYVYLSANLYQIMNPQQLISFWMTILQFTKIFVNSRHINTICWILELFYMMSWKYSPKEVLNSRELRKELHTQIKHILTILAEFCVDKNKFAISSVDLKQSITVQAAQKQVFYITVPFTPVVFELNRGYYDALDDGDGEKTEDLRDLYLIQRVLFDPYKQIGQKLTSEDFGRKCALIAFKTLKKVAYITLINTYEANKMDRVLENTQQFMNNIFPLMEDRKNIIIVEASSEILYALLKNSKDSLPKEFKKQILDIFNGTDFFKCSKRNLKYWREIIDWTSDKGDLLMDQLGGNQNLMTGFAGLFSSKNAETMKKIKGFERVCFIIYSGAVDKYHSKINILLDAILDSIKEIKTQAPAITVLIIFCIRILIIRLSPQSLQLAFRRIWPALISMLIELFSRKGVHIKNPNVLLAALKLVELLSLFQLEEFYFYQWIFVFDFFGITIEMKHHAQEPLKDNNINGQKVLIQTPFDYVPSIGYQFPIVQDFSVNYDNILYVDQHQVTQSKKKRLIIIKDPSVESDQEVRRQAVYLCQYLIDINQQRVEANPIQIENLIEAEFITLDDYIFSMQ